MKASSSNSSNNNGGGGKPKKTNKSRKRKLPTCFLDAQTLAHVVAFPEEPSPLPPPPPPSTASTASTSTPTSQLPPQPIIYTPVASTTASEIFLERFVKEIVTLYRPNKGLSSRVNGQTRGEETVHVMVDGRLVQKTVQVGTKHNAGAKESSTQIRGGNKKLEAQSHHRSNPLLELWKERIVLGTNQCTRILERTMGGSGTTENNDASHTIQKAVLPSLIVLARDVYPPTMLAHVPVLARRYDIPLLLLPGRASVELGKAMGLKRTSVLLFLPRKTTTEICSEMASTKSTNGKEQAKLDESIGIQDDVAGLHHARFDSFVDFIKTHIIPGNDAQGKDSQL